MNNLKEKHTRNRVYDNKNFKTKASCDVKTCNSLVTQMDSLTMFRKRHYPNYF